MLEADGRSQEELIAGAETLEKLQALPVGETVLFTPGRETHKEFAIPIADRFW